jgi:inosine/xanthosine triphosphate pyrophosphatase family protein
MTALLRAVLESPGATDPALRQSTFHGEPLDGLPGEYAAKIRGQSYRINDEDVKRLLESGLSQDAVFELTIAAALGAAAERMDAGMRAMREGR